MKPLITLLFLALAISCAEPEEIIKYVDKPVYITQTVTETDTLFTTKEVVKDSIVYVPVFEAGQDSIIHHYDTVYVPVFVEVVDTVYVERKANITYHPRYEPFVTHFFEKLGSRDLIIMDIHIDDIPADIASGADPRFNTNINTVKNGALLIWVTAYCAEAVIYRELLHSLYAQPYLDEWYEWDPARNDQLMAKNWSRCLENMNDEERTKYLEPYGLQ